MEAHHSILVGFRRCRRSGRLLTSVFGRSESLRAWETRTPETDASGADDGELFIVKVRTPPDGCIPRLI